MASGAAPEAQVPPRTSISEKEPPSPSDAATSATDGRLEESIPTVAYESASSDEQESSWPKGWRPYFALIGCFFLMWNSWGLVNAYGTFQSYYFQHLLYGTSILRLNLIGSSESFFVLALSFIAGRLLDAGYQVYLLGVGSVLTSLGMFLLGVANQVAVTWFPNQRAMVVGIVASGASIAGLTFPVMTKFLISKIGFKYTTFCDGGLILFTSAFAFFFARPPAEWYRTKSTKPKNWWMIQTWFDPAAFRNAAFVWFVAAIALMFFGFYSVFFNLEDWAAYHGYGKKDAVPGAFDQITTPSQHEKTKDAIRTFYLLAMMNASSTIGRIGSAAASQKFGALFIHAIMTFTASLLVLCFWTALTNVAGAVTFAVLFGAFSGAVIGLPPASIMFILHHDNKGADKLRVGQWTGMMYTFAAVFALIGPIISGAIIQTTGKYLGSQLWSGICLLLSSLCMGMAYYYADGKVKDKLYATRLGLSWTKLAGMISTVTSRNPSRQPSLSVSDNEEDRGRQDTVTEMVQYRGEEGEKDSSSPQRGGPETPAPVHLHA